MNLNTTTEDFTRIANITERALALQPSEMRQTRMDWLMDIAACHLNGCPLQLQELAAADDFNFSHDVFGIRRHIDRTTGKLTDSFLPRFAVPHQ